MRVKKGKEEAPIVVGARAAGAPARFEFSNQVLSAEYRRVEDISGSECKKSLG